MQLIDATMFTLHALNLPATLTPAEWTDIHRDILTCKKAASKWLTQSRDYGTSRWGIEFTADTEAQLELDLGLALPEAKPALNPADKTIRLGSAHHSNGEGFAGEVRNIRISNGQSGPVVSSQITLTAVNDAPTLATINTLTGATEDTAFTITHTTLAAAADEADVDNSGLAFRIEAVSTGTLTKGGVAVTAGSTTVSTGESLVWTPAANANGTLAAFTVKAWDGALASATAVPVQIFEIDASTWPLRAPMKTWLSRMPPSTWTSYASSWAFPLSL